MMPSCDFDRRATGFEDEEEASEEEDNFFLRFRKISHKKNDEICKLSR